MELNGSRMNQREAVLVVGIGDIATALGLSPSTVKKNLLGQKGFPAHQIRPKGQWITTRGQLQKWADNLG
ncbi:MAG: hypothetical protein ACRCTY_02610 [Candidatus Adiutrix sp.]